MKTWVRQCVEHEDPGMSLELYGHPFSSYCQKVLIALYEKDVAFAFRILGAGDTKAGEELETLWPLKRIPVLVDAGRVIAETTIIIEHLDLNHTGKVRLIPADAHLALNVRLMDRVFDNYVSTPMQKIVLDSIRDTRKARREGCRGRAGPARCCLPLAGRCRGRARLGRRRQLQPRRLLRGASAVLCRLG